MSGGDTAVSLIVSDLFMDLTECVEALIDALQVPDPLDAFLLSAGAVQIVEDHLQRDAASLRRAARQLRDKRAAATLIRAAQALENGRRYRPGERREAHWCARMTSLRDQLAADACSAGTVPEGALPEARRLHADLQRLPEPGTTAVVRLPVCFRSFDLQVADARRLAADFARTPGPARPVVVVGVRTSGSYLAPLVAAALVDLGIPAITITVRPGCPVAPRDRARLARGVTEGAAVAIVDDPPDSGASVRQSVELLTETGVPADAITLLLPLFEDRIPPGLTGYRTVPLPFTEWAVHRRLDRRNVAAVLTELAGQPVHAITRESCETARPVRGHVSAVFHVRWKSGENGDVAVIGTGLGYLGRHTLAVARAVPGYLPRTFGFRDGLLMREWLPRTSRLAGPDLAVAPELANYVADRAAAMPARRDRSLSLRGRQPVWEIASQLLARGYGRVGIFLLLPLLDPAVRWLCAVERPSIIDGARGLDRWFRIGDNSLRAVDTDVHAFANTERACYDAAFDLAGIAPGCSDPTFTAALRHCYRCSDERFLLYQLVHLEDRVTRASTDPAASARAVRRYVASHLPAPPSRAGGPLCAIDIDGVLECDRMGFSVLTPTALHALRALGAHGYRPVVATGRSLDEVRDRCLDLDLAGGVAEYGSVAYRACDGRTIDLVDPADRAALDGLRDIFRATRGIHVDTGHRHSVRAGRTTPGGPVPADAMAAALAALGPDRNRLQIIHGQRQTDVVARPVTKAAGLFALCELLGTRDVGLAIGDTGNDLPMLAIAEHSYAPGNAAPEVRDAGIHILRSSYAAGLSTAVGALLGHRPGGCQACTTADPSGEVRLMLSIIDAQRAGKWGLPGAIARTAMGAAHCAAGRARSLRTG
jgi:adenine/guanine phosphoribosyltransferase-like PRPP-binding protein